MGARDAATAWPARERVGRLRQRGPAALEALCTLTVRGDWRTRTEALSAIGSIVREDPTAWRRRSVRHVVARRAPWLSRRLLPTSGPRGLFVRGALVNRLVDRSWIVRTAAALSLGECRDPGLADRLRPLLSDTYRPVRVAAAAALACGGWVPTVTASSILEQGLSPPVRIGDTGSSAAWLELLAANHLAVLRQWRSVPGAEDPGPDLKAWAGLLSGRLRPEPVSSASAEIARYADPKDQHYNLVKPFSPGVREQNTWLLHSFLTVAENMQVPPRGIVLDLGGGAGWVSELLERLGYRAVTLDLARPLLGLAQVRLTRAGLPSRLVAADMTALPFGAGLFDAVMVIDALHHAPDVAGVFAEVSRVLRQGGQFLLAEPGEGHAESGRARAEVGEHGVSEREIHLGEISEYGRAAGFDRAEVVLHCPPSLLMDPEDFQDAMVTRPEEWKVRQGEKAAAFDEFILQSTLCHPIALFGKGSRPRDSRAPGELRAEIEASLERRGRVLQGKVCVTNVGDTVWLGLGDEPGRVRLGAQLLTRDLRVVDRDYARWELPSDIAPGERIGMNVAVELPDGETHYVVKLDMVDEALFWFEDQGSKAFYSAV